MVRAYLPQTHLSLPRRSAQLHTIPNPMGPAAFNQCRQPSGVDMYPCKLALWGQAFPVLTAGGAPIVAASQYGSGRVVVFGDEGLLAGGEDPDNSAFLHALSLNAVRWAARWGPKSGGTGWGCDNACAGPFCAGPCCVVLCCAVLCRAVHPLPAPPHHFRKFPPLPRQPCTGCLT